MASSPPTEAEGLLGSIVAFEGKSDIISTQLRLLPTSPQLLILPSVESYIKAGADEQHECFDARSYIRKVHNALAARAAAARSFLNEATTGHKRLVFVNGGTPGAQALCVREIMRYETHGDRSEAEAIFDEIIKEGVAGLERRMPNHELEADPITRAMRAADALDRQTACLQPPNPFEMGRPCRARSSSLPLYGFSDEFEDSTPFYVFGLSRSDEEVPPDEIAETLSEPSTPSVVVANPRRLTLDTTRIRPSFSTILYSASCIGEAYEPIPFEQQPETAAASPISEAFSIPASEKIVYGEASVLDVRQSFSRNSVYRVKSLDRIYTASTQLRDAGIPSESWLAEPDTPRAWKHRHSIIPASDAQDRRLSLISLVDKPRTIVVKSRRSVVKMEPVPVEKKTIPPSRAREVPKANYVDRGTDACKDSSNEAVMQPVFRPMEDLVVFFKDESSDAMLESNIQAFKDGRYPLLPYSAIASNVESTGISVPNTPILRPFPREETPGAHSNDHGTASPGKDDYDPFAYKQPAWHASKPEGLVSTVSIVRPPTPAQTPPPTTSNDDGYKVHEFHVTSGHTAVSIQNSLRSVLSQYFPPDTQGYRQFQFSLLPEFDELWKPIFRGGEPGSPQRNDGSGTNILAIGSQAGVRKEYSLAVTGRLEKIGRKSTEIVKTGRVDFRYLLANAMQAFTAQRLANQTSDNPFTNSFLLATLIVPHLETYLALHTDVRHLLLLYPPEHLATVLALQRLVGVQVMKVAQIVDSESKGDLPFTHIRGASINNSKSENKPPRCSFSPRSSSEIDISKANYLLTSTASEKDIATFVSTVWNIEIEPPVTTPPSDRHTVQPAKKKRPPPLSIRKEPVSSLPKVASESPISPTTVLVPPAPPMPPEPSSPVASLRAPSLAETLKTFKSAKSKFSQGISRVKSSHGGETESLAGFEYDEDSDEDVYERRLMPVFMQKHLVRKPNSRKALKFLGLA